MARKKTFHISWMFIVPLIIVVYAHTYSQVEYSNKIDSVEIYIDHHFPDEAIRLINTLKHENESITKEEQLELDIYKMRTLMLAELFDEALQLSQKILKINHLTPNQLAKVNNSRALIFESFRKFTEAQNCLNTVQNLFQEKQLKKDRTYSNYLIRQSSLYKSQTNQQENSEYYNLFVTYAQKAYQFAKENNYPLEEGLACMLLGFNSEYSISKRKTLFEKSFLAFEKINNKHGQATVLANIAHLEQEQQYNQKAMSLLKNAEKKIENTKSYSSKAHIYKEISNLYEKMGEKNKSYIYFKKFHQANQAYNYLQKNIKISELNHSFLLAKENLKKNALKQKLKQTKSNNTKLIILSIVLLLGSFALINFALNLRKTQDELFKQKEFVEEKSIEVRRSLNEKEILLRELNHRVRNNLALIISLAQFHTKEIKDPTYKEQFQQFENRLQSICYAHDLYIYELNNDASNKVVLKAYIKKIVNGLIAINTKTIHPNLFIEDLSLNLETALPIGIIVNELITNTIKHATPIINQNIEFSLTISKTESFILIDYYDNGKKKNNKSSQKGKEQKSLGLFIIENMVRQLFGNLEEENYHYKIKLRV